MALSYKNDEQSDERLDPYNNLRHAEQQTGESAGDRESISGYDRSKDGLDDHPISAGIADAKEQESTPQTPNEYGYSPSSGKQKVNGRVALAKKLGPTGLITLLFGGGAGILMTLLAPGIALVHVKEIVENKINTQASVMQTRADKLMASRLLGGTNKAIRGCNGGTQFFCRYTKLGQAQIQAMEENGIVARDNKGHVLSSAELESGKVRPATLSVGQDGKQFKASAYQRTIATNVEFRDAMRNVYPSRFASWNDKIATTVASVQEWVRSPKSVSEDEGGNPKKVQQEFNQNVAEEVKGSTDLTSGLDEGEFSSPISDETTRLNNNLQSGVDTSLETNTGSVLKDFKSVSASGVNKVGDLATSFLNPLSPLVAVCSTKSYMSTIVTAVKIAGAIETIRFASMALATADKEKAGNATPNDVSNTMNMLEKQNNNGQAFGDSLGYSYVEYGKTTSTPKEVGATGSWIGTFFANALYYMTIKQPALATITGKKVLGLSACDAIQSKAGQATAILAGLFGGDLLTAAKDGIQGGGKTAIKAVVDKLIQNVTERFAAGAMKKNLIDLSVMGGSFIGLWIAGTLIAKYFTPFLAHLATGTLMSGDMNGVAAMDNIVAGAGAMNGSVAQQRGMMALTPSQAMAFLGFNNSSTATYVADQQKQANPLDIHNPYSASNQLGFSLSSFFSSVNIAQDPGSILSLPSKVFSAINPANDTSSSVYADSTAADQQALMSECQDTDATQNGTIATDPFCNPIYGFDNVSMLQNTDPSDVADWMNQHGYIDSNGNPTSNGSPTEDYASYVNTCFGQQTATQAISSITNDDLPSECYKPTGIDQQTYDYWHLYQIDSSVIDAMDNGFPQTTNSGTNSGGGSQFRIATYNMKSGSTSAMNQTAVNNMKSNNFNVVGMQELGNQKIFSSVKSKLQAIGYDIYPENYTGSWDMNATAIAWDTSRFKLVGTDEVDYPSGCSGLCATPPGQPTKSPVVTLQDTQTGQQVIVMNVHTIAGPASVAQEYRYKAAQIYIAKIQQLQSQNLPIILVGDFNEGFGKSPVTQDFSHTFYCMLQSQNLMSSPFVSDPKQYCNPPSQSGFRPDHIYISSGMQGTSNYLSGNMSTLGTDHPKIPYSDITIPSSGGSAATSALTNGSFTLFGRDGFTTGSCVIYIQYVMGRHLPKYKAHPMSFPTGSVVASDLHTVYGYTLNHTPAAGAVVSYPAGYHANASAGHVGIVQSVNSDGSIVVQDSNYVGSNLYGTHPVSADIAKNLWYAHVENDWK